MYEILMIVGAVWLMYRVAEADDKSGAAWAALTAIACIASLYVIPLFLIRIPIVVAGMYIAMFVCRIVTDK